MVVTNPPPDRRTVDVARVLARLRWQIELTFKLWQQRGGLVRSRSDNPERIATELFARLLAATWTITRARRRSSPPSLGPSARDPWSTSARPPGLPPTPDCTALGGSGRAPGRRIAKADADGRAAGSPLP
jgi:hypothetical protein